MSRIYDLREGMRGQSVTYNALNHPDRFPEASDDVPVSDPQPAGGDQVPVDEEPPVIDDDDGEQT